MAPTNRLRWLIVEQAGGYRETCLQQLWVEPGDPYNQSLQQWRDVPVLHTMYERPKDSAAVDQPTEGL